MCSAPEMINVFYSKYFLFLCSKVKVASLKAQPSVRIYIKNNESKSYI